MLDKKNDFLCHQGIKGQRWGIRRFQRLDGSLTPAGYERYGKTPWDRGSDKLKRQVERNRAWLKDVNQTKVQDKAYRDMRKQRTENRNS